jgi:hypothetical protein
MMFHLDRRAVPWIAGASVNHFDFQSTASAAQSVQQSDIGLRMTPMRQRNFTDALAVEPALRRYAVTVIATMLIVSAASPASAANAAHPPGNRCRPASKIEYNSARKQFLLRNRFGMYVRTGWIWRRHYWYCQF